MKYLDKERNEQESPLMVLISNMMISSMESQDRYYDGYLSGLMNGAMLNNMLMRRYNPYYRC